MEIRINEVKTGEKIGFGHLPIGTIVRFGYLAGLVIHAYAPNIDKRLSQNEKAILLLDPHNVRLELADGVFESFSKNQLKVIGTLEIKE